VTTPYTLGDSGRPDGYGTRVTHQVPAGTLPDDIISFYETRLTGWDNLGRENVNCSDGSGNDSPCDIITIRFRRGAAMVAINTDNLATPASSFDISVEATRCERDPDDAFCHR